MESSPFVQQIGEEIRRLLMPPRPVMVHVVSPVIEPRVNAALGKEPVDFARAPRFLPCALSGADDRFVPVVFSDERMVVRKVLKVRKR